MLLSTPLSAQYLIEGTIRQPTTRYKVFLSILENWNQFNTIGQDMIIKETTVDSTGNFRFSGNELSEKAGFYRIHFSAEGEPVVMILAHKTNKEIAGELFISDSTVKTHINNIYRKLNTKTRKEIFEKFSQTP